MDKSKIKINFNKPEETNAPPQVAIGGCENGGKDGSWCFNLNDAAPFDPLLSILLFLAKKNSIPTSPQALTSGLPLVNHKLTPELFKRAASRIGLAATIMHIDLRNIKKQQLPAVVLLRNSQACILNGIDKKSGNLRIVQPEAGEGYNEIAFEDLQKNYIGFTIVVKPTYHFDSEVSKVTGRATEKNWFWRAMSKTIPFYGNVLAASFLINLFAIASPLFIMNVYDRVVPNAAIPTLWVLAIGVAVVFIFDFLLRNLRAFFIDSVGQGVDEELSRDTFEHMMGLEMSDLPSSSSTLANAVNNFAFFREFITSASVSLLVDIPFALMFIVVMAYLAGSMAMVPIVIIPIMLFISFFAQSSLRDLVDKANQFNAEKYKVLAESLTGVETIKCVRAEGVMQKKWELITKHLAKLNARIRLLANIGVNSSVYANQMAMVAVVVVGVYKIATGDITMGALIACVILVSRTLAPVSQVAVLLTKYRQSKNALLALDNVMKLPVERENEKSFLHREDLKGSFEFKDVSFSYPAQEIMALDHFSLKVNPGEKVGIIGPTGSGKSTLEKLLLKLYPADSGSILLDGVEIKQVDPSELRHHIGYVPQDIVLFNGTIRDNVAIAAPYVDDSVILRAIRMSGLGDFVTKHPQGLDRPIFDRGHNLSGGQRQAVAIARALLLDPSVLLLDEPCNSMDERAVANFLHNLAPQIAHKTVILTTHQYPLLRMVDRLIVVDSGHVVLDGPKQEVLDKLRQATAKVREAKKNEAFKGSVTQGKITPATKVRPMEVVRKAVAQSQENAKAKEVAETEKTAVKNENDAKAKSKNKKESKSKRKK